MNPDYQEQLEAAIDRELKALPELPAPHGLAPRVMAAVERRARVRWYQQSWQAWPVGLQAASLALMLACFAGLCFAAWKLPATASFAAVWQYLAEWSSGLARFWNTLNVVFGAVVLVAKKLGTGFLVGCLVAVGLGCSQYCSDFYNIFHL